MRGSLPPGLPGCTLPAGITSVWFVHKVWETPVQQHSAHVGRRAAAVMPGSFAHLHVHTEYSMLDGAARVDDLFAEAARMGIPALAMTDHGQLFGAVDFYLAGQKHGVKPILGAEAYLAPGSRFEKQRRDVAEPYSHLTLLAENQTGYANLLRLVSAASLEGYFYKPRMDRELFERYGEGLIATSGCLGSEVNQRLLKGDRKGAAATLAEFRDLFGAGNYFVELHDHGLPEQRRVNPDLIAMARDLGLPLLASNDLHYTRKADASPHEVLLCIQTGAVLADPKRFKLEGEQFYLKTPAEMRALFADHPEACDNTLEVAERCNVQLRFGENLLPHFDVPDGHTLESWLRAEVERGAAQRYGDPLPPDARDRIDYELQVIDQLGFAGYFLIVADLCRHAREHGIRVGPGRGSAAGSCVSYCLGITDLDPIAYGLMFERFLNPGRNEMPDIDLDFDERRRGDMIRYATEKYGADHVAQIVTFSTIKAKQAIRDSARVLGFPYKLGDDLAKAMPPPVLGKERSLAEAFKLSAELRVARDNDP